LLNEQNPYKQICIFRHPGHGVEPLWEIVKARK